MQIETWPANAAALQIYCTIPIAFEVRSMLQPRLVEGGMGGVALHEVDLPEPYLKDYDLLPDGGPAAWPGQFNLENWAALLIKAEAGYLAGAVVAFDTPGVMMLEGRRDLAVLWDIRVHPAARRRGFGGRLFQEAVAWASGRGCTDLKVETQNTNVPACRFYARQGCELRAIDRLAYAADPQVAGEIMLIWQKKLG